MQVRFYANLRSIIDKPMLDITDPGIRTLRELFDFLIVLNPKISPHLFDELGNLRSDVPIFINGRNPRLTNAGLDLVLDHNDVISLFSPIASGRMNVESMRDVTNAEKE